ncbi:N-acetylglucosamine kinase [Numidum massiliense]|uniref:N-acetylglucosamine kinase n=1 Tax=Numidum massiliense TaxID=1522315 RepID=UPI0006D59506|nr:BadF/BadG/BcrA/BcrD ATPase family protein [Numidum massiliense]
MTIYIGIDGGGTKTAAVAADAEGNILGEALAGSSNLNGTSEAHVLKTFHTIKAQLAPHVQSWRDSVIFAGVAGTSHSAQAEKVHACLREAFGKEPRLTLDHDGMNALGSVTFGGPGVVQIAGTGAITFGIGKKGERCRVGGWGYLLGDEGSGFQLGRRALVQVMKAYDGRGPATALTELALSKWQVSSPADLIPKLYGSAFKETIASFTYELFQAHADGDRVAAEVVAEAADELALAIHTALTKLDLTGDAPRVGLIGGAFQPALQQLLAQKMAQSFAVAPKFIRPQVEPVIGALAWAYTQAGLAPQQLLQKSFA